MRTGTILGAGLAMWVLAACSTGEETSSGFTTLVPPTTNQPPTGTTTGADSTGDPSTGEEPTGGASTTTGETTAVDTTGSVQSTGESTGDPGSTGDASTGAPAVCGDGVPDVGEACDDGNPDNTDACLDTCVAAACGDTFVQVGVEACDGGSPPNATCGPDCALQCAAGFGDCNMSGGDGCELSTLADNANCGGCGVACAGNQQCMNGTCVSVPKEFGPDHTFVGLVSNHFITQGSCAVGDVNANADYFCKHFYNANCTAKPGYVAGGTPFPEYPKMHKLGGCTNLGSDIPNTTCDGGPCKIGNWAENTSGVNNIVCVCP
jgi:hypothetical protein